MISFCAADNEGTTRLDQNNDGKIDGVDDVLADFYLNNLVCNWVGVARESSRVAVSVTIRRATIDFNGSGAADYEDLSMLADRMGETTGEANYDEAFDVDGDGMIDFDDFFEFSDRW
jgi:hypothetical protein